MRLVGAILACGLLVFPLSLAAAAPDDATESAHKWFNTEGVRLAAAASAYLPAGVSTAGEPKPVLGEMTQVATWSKSMLKGNYSPKDAVVNIGMWVAPVTESGIFLGVVVYTGSAVMSYPVRLPKHTRLAPKIIEGIPEPTPRAVGGSSGGLPVAAFEPKNSHLPVKSAPPGAVYILPDLARALSDNQRNRGKTLVPVYDPVIQAWFVLSGEQLTAVSATGRNYLAGSVKLSQVREAIQSWWGTAKATPAPDLPEAKTVAPSATVIGVVLASLLGASLVAALIALALRRQAKAYDEVVPLDDPDLIVVPPPPPTTAVPTIPVSLSGVQQH